MGFDEFQQVLERAGGRVEPIERRERHALLQAWREVYAAPYYHAKGRWKLSQFEWHVFSYGYTRALNGEPAMAAYSNERADALCIFPEGRRLASLRIIGGALPDFRQWGGDVCVWPNDLSWTIAFTHEASLGLGPFFSRREWAESIRAG